MSSGGGGGAPMRDLYSETYGELQAKEQLAPDIFATEARFRPQYSALDLEATGNTLFGTPAGKRTVPTSSTQNVYRNAITGEISPTMPAGNYGISGGTQSTQFPWLNSPQSMNPWLPYQQQVSGTQEVDQPGAPGLLDQLARTSAQYRSQDLNALGFAPQFVAGADAADPTTAGILGTLGQQANEDLALGGRLSPEQLRQIKNNRLGISGANGWGYNPGDLARTAMETTDYATNLRSQRQQSAAGVAGLRQSYYTPYIQRAMGAQQDPMSILQTAYGISGSAGPRLFGSTVNAGDVFSSNQNAAAANSAAAQSNRQANTSTAVAGGAAVAGAAIIAI